MKCILTFIFTAFSFQVMADELKKKPIPVYIPVPFATAQSINNNQLFIDYMKAKEKVDKQK